MPAKEQALIDIDARKVSDVSLKYDLALRPAFEINMPTTTFEKVVLKTDDAFIDERLEGLRKQLGESKTRYVIIDGYSIYPTTRNRSL